MMFDISRLEKVNKVSLDSQEGVINLINDSYWDYLRQCYFWGEDVQNCFWIDQERCELQ